MSRWLSRALRRIHGCAVTGAVRLTIKARDELSDLGLARADVLAVLAALGEHESRGRSRSSSSREWLYVFAPLLGERRLYVKLVLRQGCHVISFHEVRRPDEEEE